MVACIRSIMQSSLSFFFAFIHFSYSNTCLFQEEQSFKSRLLLHGFLSLGYSSSQESFSCVDSPQATRKQPALLQSMGCKGISPPAPVAHPYLPCSLIWVSAGLFLSHFHCSCLPQPLQCFLLFFNHFFTEALPDHLRGSAMPCSRSIGASWDWLHLVKGRTWPFTQRPPLQGPAHQGTSNKCRSILENIS